MIALTSGDLTSGVPLSWVGFAEGNVTGMDDRRRGPRNDGGGVSMALPVAESVRVLDLSRGGLLLQTVSRPEIGSRARLKLSVGGEPLAADVEVRRVAVTHGGFHVGVRFVDMTPGHRRLIERFMGQ